MELLLMKQLKLYKKSAAARTVACSSGMSGSEKASTVKVSTEPSLATKDGAKRALPASAEKRRVWLRVDARNERS
jgi:hypothetical protein